MYNVVLNYYDRITQDSSEALTEHDTVETVDVIMNVSLLCDFIYIYIHVPCIYCT